MDTFITVGGIIYGIILVTAAFAKNRLTELLRIDALFLPRPSEKTRIINLIAGVVFIAYNVYAMS